MTSTQHQLRKTPFERFLMGQRPEEVDQLFMRLPVNLIFRLRCLNSTFFLAVEAYCARTWDVHKVLDRWFYRPRSFLDTLDKCEGIVTGSQALRFLDRHGTYVPRDLDIYVPLHGLLPMGRWLKSEGFFYQESAGKHALFDAAAVMCTAGMTSTTMAPSHRARTFATFNFFRTADDTLDFLDMSGRRVQLVAIKGSPVEFMINNFHSSEFIDSSGYLCTV